MPTIKQEKAFKEMVENSRNKGEAMIRAGYSKNTAKAPTKLTKSKGWLELLEKHIPDDKLTKVLNEGLQATSKKPHLVDRDEKGKPVYEYTDEEDYSVRHKYLETGLKLKSKFPNEKLDLGATDDLKEFIEKLNGIIG